MRWRGRRHDALDDDRLFARWINQVQVLDGHPFDALWRAQLFDFKPQLPANLPFRAMRALQRLDVVSEIQQRRSLPRQKQQDHDDEGAGAGPLPLLAMARRVHFADDGVVTNIFLDGVFERFHSRFRQASRSAALSFALRALGLW